MRILKRFALVVVLGFAVLSGVVLHASQSVDGRLVTERSTLSGGVAVNVTVDPTNAYNRPWDGIGHVGGILGPFLPGVSIESPPDLMLCVLWSDETVCLANGSRDSLQSFCHDSLQCNWLIHPPRNEPYALVVFDLDVYRGGSVSDLVDAVMFGRAGDDTTRLERRVRRFAERTAPTEVRIAGSFKLPWRPGEARRRSRAITVVPPGSCSDGCKLEQSTISLTR